MQYVAMCSDPLIPANQAPGAQTGHALGVISSHRLIIGKTYKIFSETMRPTAYIFSM